MNVKKITKVFTVILAVVCLATALSACNSEKEAKYKTALTKVEQGDYEGAFALFTELGNYKEAENELAKFRFMPTTINSTSIYEPGEKPESESVVVTFNEYNLPVRSVRMLSDGTVHTATFTYDNQFRFVKATCVSGFGTDTYECFFNDKGYIYREIYSYWDGTVTTYDYTYNDKNQQTKGERTSLDGDYAFCDSIYDDKGNEIRNFYLEDGENYYGEKTYDEKGNLLTETILDEDGVTVLRTKEFTYDANGNKIKSETKEDGAVTETLTFTYDAKGNMLSETYIDADDADDGYYYELSYDNYGNVVCVYDTDAEGYVGIITYTYKLVYLPTVMPEEDYEFIMNFFLSW